MCVRMCAELLKSVWGMFELDAASLIDVSVEILLFQTHNFQWEIKLLHFLRLVTFSCLCNDVTARSQLAALILGFEFDISIF